MSDSSKKIVLKKLNSHNTIWHPDSTLVFKSQKDRLVIGRYVDDEVIPLDDIAINLCEKWKFKPDESLFEGEDEESTDEASTEKTPDSVSTEVENTTDPVSTEIEKTPDPVSTHVEKTTNPVENVSTRVEKTQYKNSGAENIKNITESFNVQLYEAVDILINEKNFLLSQLHDTEEELSDLQKKYDDKEEKLSDLQKKYDDIKKKFDTMKSLFN
jgi:chromosome segregation ATPase